MYTFGQILSTIVAFGRISRTPFLALPVALTIAGAASSAYDGGVSWWRTVLASLGLTMLHIAVNVLNEVSDLQQGVDHHTTRTPFNGGSGALVEGRLDVRIARFYGLAMVVAGLGIGAWMLVQVGWILVPILALGTLFVLTYSPLLLRSGLGEICAGLGLGGLAILGVDLVQEGELGTCVWWVAATATLMTFNLLLLNEFPDTEADRVGKRRHLVILLGPKRAGWVYAIAALSVPCVIAIAVAVEAFPHAALLAVAPVLLLGPVVRWLHVGADQPVPRSALAMNVVWNLSTNLVLAAALAISAA